MNLMLIDDDGDCLECLSKALQLNGYTVVAFNSPESALSAYPTLTIDCVVCDYRMGHTTGVDLLPLLKLQKKDVPVIIVSGDADTHIETIALQAGAAAFFQKPLSISTLISTLNHLETTSLLS